MRQLGEKIIQLAKGISKKTALLLLITFVFGGLMAFWTRFALVDKKDTHYHANFALYVNGVRDDFKSFTYYEEVSSCSGDEQNNPRTRTHMHDAINHVVHVHDKAATWGHFFANLGYVLADKVLATNSAVYVPETSNKLQFYLNGESVSSIANQVINSEDTLLINYGSDSDDILRSRYESIQKDAAEYNKRLDPSACTGGKPESVVERIKRTLGIGTNN